MSRHGTPDRCESSCSYKLLHKTRLRQELNIGFSKKNNKFDEFITGNDDYLFNKQLLSFNI
jgi:hypothetical protein